LDDGVSYCSALTAKNTVAANANAVDVQVGGKLARIPYVDLQENDGFIRRDVIILALFLLAVSILSVIAPTRLVGDDAEFAPGIHFVYETLGLTIERDLLDAQFRRSPNA
jgi:hypothetical protein